MGSENRQRRLTRIGLGITGVALIIAGTRCPELQQYGLALLGLLGVL